MMIASSKTRQQVATEYDWSNRTFRRKTKDLNLGRELLTPKQLILIYSVFGIPPKMPKKEQEFYSKQLNLI